MSQKLKLNHFYLFVEYTGGAQYDDETGKIFEVENEGDGHYKMGSLGNVGKRSIFLNSVVFKEVTKEEHPEYFL